MGQGDSVEKRSNVAISFASDASSFRRGAVINLPTGTFSDGDYWEESVRNENINVAVLKVLNSLPESVSDCRIDAQVDSMVVFHAMAGNHGRCARITTAAFSFFRNKHGY